MQFSFIQVFILELHGDWRNRAPLNLQYKFSVLYIHVDVVFFPASFANKPKSISRTISIDKRGEGEEREREHKTTQISIMKV